MITEIKLKPEYYWRLKKLGLVTRLANEKLTDQALTEVMVIKDIVAKTFSIFFITISVIILMILYRMIGPLPLPPSSIPMR